MVAPDLGYVAGRVAGFNGVMDDIAIKLDHHGLHSGWHDRDSCAFAGKLLDCVHRIPDSTNQKLDSLLNWLFYFQSCVDSGRVILFRL